MSNIYESQEYINSFNAKDPEGKTYACDAQGYISQTAGDEIVFESDQTKQNTSLNTVTIFAKNSSAQIYINDNKTYPVYIEADSSKGLQYIRIYKITAATNCTIYYEGLC